MSGSHMSSGDPSNLTAHGFTIFCDDIRQEIGGKVSLVGVYTNTLYARQLPVILGKFAISVHYREPVTVSPGTVKVAAFIEHEGDTQNILEGVIDTIKGRADIGAEPDSAEGFYEAVVSAVISPLTLPGPCKIRVRAYRHDGEVVKLGTLQVELGPEEVFSAGDPGRSSAAPPSA